jgi:hypothetical protein
LKARATCFLLGLSLAGLLVVLPASGQQTSSSTAGPTIQASAAAPADPQATPPAAAPAAAPPTWSIGPIDFAGTIDGYYSFNANHPDDKTNFLYNFNIPANTFSLNLLKLELSHTADPVGFDVAFMYGDTATQIGGVATSDSGFDKFVEQAIVTFKPAKAHGFEIDFGKFVTSAGAEVIESYSNWNYSRSLLFSWAIPYFHFGVRTSWPMGKHLTGGFQVVNGWNNDFSANSRATLGANVMATYSKWSLMETWYGGPVNPDRRGWRELFDTVLTVTPSSKFSAYLNYDWAQNRNFGLFGLFPNGSLAKWQGVAAAFHFQPTSKWAFTPRIEWFDDRQGFAMAGAGIDGSTVPDQQVKEFTFTGEYKLLEGLMWRGEYRYDWSDKPFFERGLPAPSPGFAVKNQQTATVAFIGYFGPKR